MQYVGRCPGEAAGALQARFISSKTPPAPGLRVLIRNVSDLVEGQPYTDRKYESGKFSESFWVALDNDHHQRFLSLLSGENNLEYQIKQGETVLEAGTFQVKVSHETAVVSRSGYWVEEPWDYCSHWRGRRCLRYGREYRSVLRCP